MERIVIEARGEYEYPADVLRRSELIQSLLVSIHAHLKAYGLTEINVALVSPVSPPASPAGSEPSGPRPNARTWDQSPDGRANSSALFEEIRSRIAVLIRGSAFSLINGRTEDVAHVILAQLTHGEFKMGPHQPELCEALEALWNEIAAKYSHFGSEGSNLLEVMSDALEALKKANPNKGTNGR